jgi:hypothetical protein
MNIKTTLILATTAIALLSSPASARSDGDAGWSSAFAHSGPRYTNNPWSAYASGYPVQRRRAFQSPEAAARSPHTVLAPYGAHYPHLQP